MRDSVQEQESSPPTTYREFRIRKCSVDKTIGAMIDDGMMIGLANRMGYPAVKYGNYLLVYVPPYRLTC